VRYRRTDARADTAVSFILPKKPLNLLKNILASSDTKVKIEYNQTNTSFSFENYNLVCRLIDGKYPNYEAVIPVDNPNRMTIDRLSLLGSLRRVAVFTSKTTHQVRLKIAGSQVQISAEDLDFSIAANERLACQYDGADLEIGFNARFLIDMLSNLETEEVNLEMSVPNRAGLIIPVQAEDKKHEDILMLVMPVMLNN
jgi:DNA polymerase-3 subunit beta